LREIFFLTRNLQTCPTFQVGFHPEMDISSLMVATTQFPSLQSTDFYNYFQLIKESDIDERFEKMI